MSIALYMDVNIPLAITNGLRLRGIDVVTSQEDHTRTIPDSDLLDRATDLGRVLFTFDKDFFSEASKRQSEGSSFGGVIFAQPLRVSIKKCIDDLEVFAKVGEPKDFANQSHFLPL